MAKARHLQFLAIAIIGVLLVKGSTARFEDLTDSELNSKAGGCDACENPMDYGFTEEQDEQITDCIDEMEKDCRTILAKCLSKCEGSLEVEFDVDEMADLVDSGNISMSRKSQKKLTNAMRIEFQQDEMEPQVLETIATCAEDYQTDRFFFAKKRSSSDAVANKICSNEGPIKFLTAQGTLYCKVYWYGSTQRAEFFHQCLKKFPYGRMNKKVPYLISEMRWIGTKLKRAEQKEAGQLVGGGAAQISGGLLSLIGVVLAPVTAGGSTALTMVGGAAAVAGSTASMLANNNNKEALKSIRKDTEILQKDFIRLQILHMLYIRAIDDEGEPLEIQTERSIKNALRTTQLGFNVANLATTSIKQLANMLRKPSTVPATKILAAQNRISLKLKALLPQNGPKFFSQSPLVKSCGKFLSNIKEAIKLRTNVPFAQMAGNTVIGGMNLVFGVLDVLEGEKKLKQGFSHEILWKAKQLSYTMDELKATTQEIMGQEVMKNFDLESKEWPELFSLGIHANENLRVEVKTTYDGVSWSFCTTGMIEVDGHKVIDIQEHTEVLVNCRGLRLNLNNTMVRVIPSDGNEWASIPVNAIKVDIGVDLTLAPTVTCDLSTDPESWVRCREESSMWGAKFHTSEGDKSRGTGTDNAVKMSFKIFEETENEILERYVCTTNELDNYGNDRERGSTDIYTSEQLGNCSDMITDFELFEYKNLKFKMYLDVKSNWGQLHWDGWTVDLIKLYFSAPFREAMKKGYDNSTLVENQMKKMSDYMICTHKDWETGLPYETRLYSDMGQNHASYSFHCYYKKIKNPEVAIEKIEGQVCEHTYSGTSTNELQIQLCREYNKVNNTVSQCCWTNKMAKSLSLGETFEIDGRTNYWGNTINTGKGMQDGGEETGSCEQFQLTGPDIFIKVREGGSQWFCMNELKFFGMASSITSADTEIPFATCSLIEHESDSYKGLWLYGDTVYKGWDEPKKTFKESEPIKCSLPTSSKVQALNLKVCKPLNRKDDTGSQGGNIQLKIENSNGQNCTTKNIVPEKGHEKQLNPGSFVKISHHLVLGACHELEVGYQFKLWVFNFGSDALCLEGLMVDAGGEDGRTSQYRCSIDGDSDFRTYFARTEEEFDTIPMICKAPGQF